jgi:hypothetical protein
MSLYRTNNSAEFALVDGVVIDEKAPAPSIRGAGTGVAILVGQFERGPKEELTLLTGSKMLEETFGANPSYLGHVSLRNKKFSTIKVIRAVAADAAKASFTLKAEDETDLAIFTAKHEGVYGNSIQVKVEAGSESGKKYIIEDTSEFSVLAAEEYDNIVIADLAEALEDSELVDVSLLDTSEEPEHGSYSLAGGLDGAITDVDYEKAIKVAEQEGAGNVIFLDEYTSARSAMLKTHVALTQDKICIVSGPENETPAQAIAAVASLRDADGRIIYAYNWIKTLVQGKATYTSPASWYASIISQTHPKVDPSYTGNIQFMAGAIGVKRKLTRAEFIILMGAGISAFEDDKDFGIKPKSGIVTQIANSSKLTVARRRMADYLTESVGRFLKVYQGAVNSLENRLAVKGAMLNFIQQEEDLGNLPTDNEVQGGDAKVVDIETLNTDQSIAEGKFFIQYKQRIYSSMRFIVLRAEIGESVVVTEE